MVVLEPWIEALVAVNEDIIACERRLQRQCARVVAVTEEGQVTSADEMLLASYRTSLILIRVIRDTLLAEALNEDECRPHPFGGDPSRLEPPHCRG
jgi:hypothetical protein